MQKPTDESAWTKLEKVARELGFAQPGTNRASDFCFHMTDWADDLKALARLMERPGDASDAEWEEVVHGFLIHASGHILAAAKLAHVSPVIFETPEGEGPPTTAAQHRPAKPAV